MNLWMETTCRFFLREEKPHVLCFWQTRDLSSSSSHALAKLSDEVRVDYENVPSSTTVSGHNKNSLISPDKKVEQMFKESVSKSFHELAQGATLKKHREGEHDANSKKN